MLLPYTRQQCDKAPKGESLSIFGPTNKVPNRESLGLGFAIFFYQFPYHKHATSVTMPGRESH